MTKMCPNRNDIIRRFNILLSPKVRMLDNKLKALCKYKTIVGYYTNEDGLSFGVHTFNQSIRIKQESLCDLVDTLSVIARTFYFQISPMFIKLIDKNTQDGYEFVYRSFEYDIFIDPYTYDAVVIFFFRLAKVPDKKELYELDTIFDNLNLLKGENIPYVI